MHITLLVLPLYVSLVFNEGNLNDVCDVVNILQPVAVPYLQGLNKLYFFTGQCTPTYGMCYCGISRITKRSQQPRPASSLLSPTEHVWDIMVRRFSKKVIFRDPLFIFYPTTKRKPIINFLSNGKKKIHICSGLTLWETLLQIIWMT